MADGGVMVFDDCNREKIPWRTHVMRWGVLRAVRELVLPRAKRVGLVANGDMRFLEV